MTWEVAMTPATTTPSRDAHGPRTKAHGYGLVLVAAMTLLITGCVNLVDGIAEMENDS
jgi:hypothetical protein